MQSQRHLVQCTAGLAPNAPLPPLTVHALTYAHLLERAASTLGSSISGSPGISSSAGGEEASTGPAALGQQGDHSEQQQEQQQQQEREREREQMQPLLSLARYQLELASRSAKPDELTPTARCAPVRLCVCACACASLRVCVCACACACV